MAYFKGFYPTLPVSTLIYASTDNDEGKVGTVFIVMDYVQVCSFKK